MKPEETESYRLWKKAVKSVRKVERALKERPNLSKTIVFLTNFYLENRKTPGELAAMNAARRGF